MDGSSPAELGQVAPEAPVTTPPEQPVETASAPEAASAPATPAPEAPQRPDISTLLEDAEQRAAVRKLLLEKDEELRLELQRARSQGGRKAQEEIARLRQELATLTEQATMDPTELGEKMQAGAKARLAQLQQAGQQDMHYLDQQRHWVLQEVAAARAQVDLDEKRMAALNPENFGFGTPEWNPWAWKAALDNERITLAVEKKATELAEKLLKQRLPEQVKAALTSQAAQERQAKPSPAVLPEGNGVTSDKDFLADFATGKAHDFKRARELLGLK